MSVSKPDMKAGNLVADTRAVISLFRGHEKARQSFNAATEVWLLVTALAELYCGLRDNGQGSTQSRKKQGSS